MIKLYTMPNCNNCEKVKSYLKDRNINYIEINLEKKENRDARKFYRSLRIDTAPVLVGTNNGEEWIITGYNKKKMESLI